MKKFSQINRGQLELISSGLNEQQVAAISNFVEHAIQNHVHQSELNAGLQNLDRDFSGKLAILDKQLIQQESAQKQLIKEIQLQFDHKLSQHVDRMVLLEKRIFFKLAGIVASVVPIVVSLLATLGKLLS